MLQVEFETMTAEAQKLEDAADAMDQKIASAKENVEDLLGSGWVGGAATAFRNEHAGWNEAATVGVKELRRLIAAIRDSAHDFVTTEQSGVDDLQSLTGHLDTSSISKLMGGE
jgi:WXG100 family type VII secretion target